MSKTIQEQITDMEARLNKLEKLQKLFEKMVEIELGMDVKSIHKKLDSNSHLQ